MRLAAALALALGAGGGAAEENLTLFSLGSGELDGGYWRAASAICDAVNRSRRGEIRCSPETTPGSRYNLDALAGRELDFAILQADVAANAAEAGAHWLRLVAALYDEAITLVVAPGADIAGPADLAEKVIDIGPPASGRSATVRAIMASLEVGESYFGGITELPGAAAIEALCAARIDAVLLVVGHPSALVRRALDCGARLAPFAGPRIDALLAAASYMRTGRIAAQSYDGLAEDVETIALRAALVARADAPASLVDAVARAILDRREMLGRATPLLAGLKPAEMADPGAGPPLHPGASAVYNQD